MTDQQLDLFDTNSDSPDGLWPYSASSRLIDRELAANIRTWALTHMNDAELHQLSQRQLLSMYFHQHILPTIQRVSPWLEMPSDNELEQLNKEIGAELMQRSPEELVGFMKAWVEECSNG